MGKKIYVTITGTVHYLGDAFLKEGTHVTLIKDPDNKYDHEAIRVEMKGLGKIGYVANSTSTVLGECFSAGRLYDRIGNKAIAKVKHILQKASFAPCVRRTCSGLLRTSIPPTIRSAFSEVQSEVKLCSGENRGY